MLFGENTQSILITVSYWLMGLGVFSAIVQTVLMWRKTKKFSIGSLFWGVIGWYVLYGVLFWLVVLFYIPFVTYPTWVKIFSLVALFVSIVLIVITVINVFRLGRSTRLTPIKNIVFVLIGGVLAVYASGMMGLFSDNAREPAGTLVNAMTELQGTLQSFTGYFWLGATIYALFLSLKLFIDCYREKTA